MDKRRQHLQPTLVVEPVRVRPDGRTGDLVREEVPDVVAFAGVVPREDLDEVRLQLEDLRDALRQVEFADAVPLLRGEVFELEGGEGYNTELVLDRSSDDTYEVNWIRDWFGL